MSKITRADFANSQHASETARRLNPHLFEAISQSAQPEPLIKEMVTPKLPVMTPKPTKPRRAKQPNKTELAAIAFLKPQYPKEVQIIWEAYTLRMADRCTYTPDLAVIYEGVIDFYEVKGAYIYPKALVKPRLAAQQFPQHQFFLIQKVGDTWEKDHLTHQEGK